MREHLYRGQKSSGEWLIGNLVDFGDFVAIFPKDGDWHDMVQPDRTISPEYIVDRETVGAFTGKLDRNEKQIFEGDVNQDKGVCVWNADDASFCWNYKGVGLEPMDSEEDWCKVTGSIHDHETA